MLLALMVCGITAGAVYTSTLIFQRQKALQAVSRYNLTWLASQGATELTRLEERIAMTAVAGSGVDADEVALRLDILAGRVGLLRTGEVEEFTRTDPSIGAIIDHLDAVVEQARPLVDGVDGPGGALELLKLLKPLDTQLARLGSLASTYAGDKVDEDQQSLSWLHWVFSAQLIALLACGCILVALLALSRRELQGANAAAWTLAEGLKRIGDDLSAANKAVNGANRQLQQRNSALQQRDQELFTQYQRFEAALDNMSQALCMVGADGRLIVCNRRFLQMFGLSARHAQPGTELAEVWRSITASADLPRRLVEQMFRRQGGLIGVHAPAVFFQEDADGRAIGVSHQPMGDGGWVATYEDITERRRADARISFMAHHDALTSLPNRVLFRERMEQALEGLHKGGPGFAVFCLDLDHFKDVNDTLGHNIGDMLLEVVAQRLRVCVRGSDVVARLGGDEFAILQIGSEQPEAAQSLSRRLSEVVDAPYDLAGHRVHISVSGGITFAPADGMSSDRLLKNADMALYQAKGDGRSHICLYEPEMDARLQARRLIEIDLADALRNGEFEAFYHPLVNLATGQVTGFEALLRWHHPETGLIQPAQFIPIAEDMGLIVDIGAWVLRQACNDAVGWPAGIRVAVNLSSVQFRTGSFVQVVADALAASGLAAERLELEVTESILLADNEANVRTLHELHALGVRISMDDFGTGYSSLSYLRQFPFNKIKIDQSFIREMTRSPDCVAIVTSIAQLAISLGMTTTAEGVETVEQLQMVKEAGCTDVQGFLFGRPKPVSELHLSAGQILLGWNELKSGLQPGHDAGDFGKQLAGEEADPAMPLHKPVARSPVQVDAPYGGP